MPNVLLGIGVRQCPRRRRAGLVEIDRIDFDRSGDVLQVLTAELAKLQLEFAFDLVERLTGYANATALGDAFKPGCHVNTITKYIALVLDDVADIDADAEFDALVRGHSGVALDHGALDFHTTSHGVHRACELDQHAVAGGFDDTASVFSDARIDQLATVRLERGEGSHLIDTHQAAVAHYIRCQNGRQPALHGFPRERVFGGTTLLALYPRDKPLASAVKLSQVFSGSAPR